MREHFGKYWLDVSKLAVGGMVFISITKQDLDFWTLVGLGIAVAALAALWGYILLKKSNKKK